MEENKIEVEIQCWRTVRYSKLIEITKSDYEKLKEFDGDDIMRGRNEDEYFLLDSLVDSYDILDTQDEFNSFTINELNYDDYESEED